MKVLSDFERKPAGELLACYIQQIGSCEMEGCKKRQMKDLTVFYRCTLHLKRVVEIRG